MVAMNAPMQAIHSKLPAIAGKLVSWNPVAKVPAKTNAPTMIYCSWPKFIKPLVL